jgi:predicted DsbA family dithiol-disulfide isomerase
MNKFRRCVEDVSTEASVRQKIREAFQMDIKQTPIFLIGIRKPSGTIKALRMIEGGYPYDVFKTTLEALIATRE